MHVDKGGVRVACGAVGFAAGGPEMGIRDARLKRRWHLRIEDVSLNKGGFAK
jgi:hypothetical protein